MIFVDYIVVYSETMHGMCLYAYFKVLKKTKQDMRVVETNFILIYIEFYLIILNCIESILIYIAHMGHIGAYGPIWGSWMGPMGPGVGRRRAGACQ